MGKIAKNSLKECVFC